MIVTRSDYATGLGKGMPTKEAGRSKRQKRGTKMQRRSSFYIRRLPPLLPPSRRGATVVFAFGKSLGFSFFILHSSSFIIHFSFKKASPV